VKKHEAGTNGDLWAMKTNHHKGTVNRISFNREAVPK